MEKLQFTKFDEKLLALGMRGFPHTGIIEITKRCNAQCDYCYIKQEPDIELNTNQIKYIVDKLNDTGILSLGVTGGEPFIREDILEILSYMIDKDFFEIFIQSNGTLITADHLDFLKANSGYVKLMRFSLFSHVPEIHDRYIGVNGGFQKAFSSAITLKEAGFRIICVINLMDFNLKTIHTTRKFFESYGFEVSVGSYKMFANDRIKHNYRKATSKEFFKDYLRTFEPEELNVIKKDYMNKISAPLTDCLCGLRQTAVSINYRGQVVPCIVFRDMPVADLLTDKRTIPEILTSSQSNQLFRNLKKTQIDKCGNCRYINYCILCPGASHEEFGSMSVAQDQACNWAHAVHEIIEEDATSNCKNLQ